MHKHTLALTALVSGGGLGSTSEEQAKSLLTLPCPAQAAAPQATEAPKQLDFATCVFNELVFCQVSVLERFAKII